MVARNALVLSVWTPAAAITPLDPLGDMVGQLSGIYEEMDAAGAALAQRQAAEGVTIAQRAGFDAEPLTARGKPSSEIVRVAAEHDVASIILGARGVGALSAALLGSVAARIAQHCGQPVLIVPREVDRDEGPHK
jgi:nucleotide-binding universal stress UspA family protein